MPPRCRSSSPPSSGVPADKLGSPKGNNLFARRGGNPTPLPGNASEPPPRNRPLLLDPNPTPEATTKPKGGPAFHRDGCICNPCKARRRAAEAIALANGEGSGTVEAQSGVLVKQSEVGSHIARGHIANWIKFRAAEPELTNNDIAKRLGIAPKTLNNHIYRARKEGWLQFEDPLEEVEYGIVPKVVKNLNKFLDDEDKVVTLEVAKGTLFKQFQDAKGISEKSTNIIAIKLELPEVGVDGVIASGNIVGKPKPVIEAEVIHAEGTRTETDA